MKILRFSYYSIKEPDKIGVYYTEDIELPDDADDALIAQMRKRLLIISDGFLSDFCIKNHFKRTDVLPRIESVILKNKED